MIFFNSLRLCLGPYIEAPNVGVVTELGPLHIITLRFSGQVWIVIMQELQHNHRRHRGGECKDIARSKFGYEADLVAPMRSWTSLAGEWSISELAPFRNNDNGRSCFERMPQSADDTHRHYYLARV